MTLGGSRSTACGGRLRRACGEDRAAPARPVSMSDEVISKERPQMKQRRRKTMKSLILALAVAAVVTPVAQARLDSERSQVSQSPASLYSSQELNALTQRSIALNQKYDPAIRALKLRSYAMNAWYAKHPSTPVIPDAFSRELTKAQSVAAAVRHADDRAGIRGPGLVQTPQAV